MSKVRLRPWSFGKGERVKLHWLCSPHRDPDGKWLVRAVFVRENYLFYDYIDYPWGTLPLLRMGRSYANGHLLENDPNFAPQKLTNYDFRNGSLCDSERLPHGVYDLSGDVKLQNEKLWRFWFNKTHHFLPCIELLRAFLTPSKLLANQILKPNGLDFLFDEVDQKDGVLEIALSDDIPRNLVTNETVAHLVWLKYNETAQACWNSVYSGIFAQAIAASPQQPTAALATGLAISLKPPVDKACELHFSGIKSGSNCLMLELIGAKNLTAPPFRRIIYSHRSLSKKKLVDGPKQRKGVTAEKEDEDFELDAQNRSSKIDSGQPIADTVATTLEFEHLPKFTRVTTRESLSFQGEPEQSATPSPKSSGTGVISRSNIVNTDESSYGGEVQPVDFLGIKLAAPADTAGLTTFLETINYIASRHIQPQLRLNIIEVPGEKACCRHANGSKRACAVVEVSQENLAPCYILEVARADDKSTSTLFFRLLPSPDSEDDVSDVTKKLLEELVKRDGHWNAERLDQDKTLMVKRLKHVSDQSAPDWSRRILDKLIGFGFTPIQSSKS